ncbi:MAG: hypothetical protein ABEH78_07315 [Haloferacaceae archaeon]
MVGSRTLTALVGLAVSLAVSAAVWLAFDTLLLFLFVPFVPFLFSRGLGGGTRGTERPGHEPERRGRECPTCGFRTDDPRFDYCPRDGTPLDGAPPDEVPPDEAPRDGR